ncbi:MAG: alpha/beta fold hydrolase [Acidimicrobiales bacterium]
MIARTFVAVVVAAALAVSACTGGDGTASGGDGTASRGDGTASGGDGTASDRDCPPEAAVPGVRCLTVTVPLDRENPGQGRVELAVAVIDNDDTVVDSPVVFLNGGPGGGIVHLAAAFRGFPFDVVAIDLRGSGISEPSLDCPEIDSAFAELLSLPAGGSEDDDRYAALLEECQDRLVAAGVDLDAFDTAAAAADVASVRAALGYDEWNLWGSSYGTWVALAVLRDYPTGVRSVVLDATLPPDVDFLAELPVNATRAFTELASACSADSACAGRFGDVRTLIRAAADRLAADPVSVSVVRPGTGEGVDVLVDAAAFYGVLFDAMYDTSALGRLPLLIERAADGDLVELVQRFVDGRDPNTLVFSEALYEAVVCSDDVPFAEPQTVTDGLAGRDPGFIAAFDTGDFFEDCAAWPLDASEESEDLPVVSDVPTLLVTGRFDPVTPPAWTRRAAETLTRSTVVEMPARGHGLAVNDVCSLSIMLAFLDEPTAILDLACVAAADAVRFVTD